LALASGAAFVPGIPMFPANPLSSLTRYLINRLAPTSCKSIVNSTLRHLSVYLNAGSYLNYPLAKTTKEVAMTQRREPSTEEISKQAYNLYIQRGGEHGKDIEDWIRAEEELSAELIVAPAKTRAARAGQTN
jgi:Protein of unknown function (DUF2934)